MAGGQFGAVLQYIRDLGGPRGAGDPTDSQLLERFVSQRDETAFTRLMQRYGPLVWGLCQRVLRREHDAEDVFQATFLLLVRKAGSIVKRESVGSWLYGVAYRIARQVKAEIAKRPLYKGEMTGVAASDTSPQLVWRDLRPVLDEEVNRLPEKYRVPFVLCYLEGKTNAEAARQLGCPTGTILSRLARARERLRTRLARRGLTLSAGALAVILSPKALTAAVPPALLHSTIKAALLAAAGPAALAGTASARVTALTEGMVRTMFLAKVRTAAVLVLVLAALGLGAGLAARQVLAEKPRLGGEPQAGRDQPKQPDKPGDNDRPKEQGKTDPPGVPLEARLIVNKDTYALDLDDRTPEDFRKEAEKEKKAAGGNLPPPPKVDLALEFRNTGNQDVVLLVGGDEGVPRLELKGPGVITISLPTGISAARFQKGTRVTLAPGKTHQVPIQQLVYFSAGRGSSTRHYWVEAGEYTLTASYQTAVSPVPKGAKNRGDGFGAVTITSAPVKLTVVEPTESQKLLGKTDPPEIPLEARLVVKKDTYTLDLGGRTPEEFRKEVDPEERSKLFQEHVKKLKESGKKPEEVRKELEEFLKNRKLPPVPAVDLVLEVHNNGKESVLICVEESHQTSLSLGLRGPGAAEVGNSKSPDPKPAKFVELAPGKSRSISITSLLHTDGTQQQYWTQAGEYTLRAHLRTVVLTRPDAPKEGGPAPGRHFVTLTSSMVKLTVKPKE